jgi:hypothetical protein
MTIYRVALVIAALGLAVAFVSFLPSQKDDVTAGSIAVSAAPASARISIWEIHNLAHLEFLPVQQFEDQSVVFQQAQR